MTPASLPPLSLYLHFPWCVRKCPYCDFNSHALKTELPETAYVEALLRDLEFDLPRVAGRRIESVFMGGGTPSLFSPDAIATLLDSVRTRIEMVPDAEITLEANPGTVETARFAGYRDAGVTRLSIGVQSFAPQQLERLGRIHSADEAVRAAEAAHAAGLHNFNLDLMYGLPGQNVDAALQDLRQAVALDPAHLSHYQLTLEPNTLFYAQPPPLPDEEQVWAMQQACQGLLAEAGFTQYEISAYARPARQCRHNLNYWRYGDYLGLGAGAHAKLTDREGRRWRLWKVKHPAQYLREAGTAAGLGGLTVVPQTELGFEFMLNRLRLHEPFTSRDFEAATGEPFTAVLATLEHAATRGLMHSGEQGWQVTARGQTYLNDLQQLFLPEPTRAQPRA